MPGMSPVSSMPGAGRLKFPVATMFASEKVKCSASMVSSEKAMRVNHLSGDRCPAKAFGFVKKTVSKCFDTGHGIALWRIQIPIDGGYAVRDKIFVGLGKVAASEKTLIGRERGRVRAFEDEVFFGIDELFFAPRIAAPEQKDEMFFFFAQERDDGIGEPAPTAAGV